MRQLITFSFVSALLLVTTACDNGTRVPDYYGPFLGKLEAALAISDRVTRDTALAKLAAEAAAEGEAKVVTIALSKINDAHTKDRTAATCVDVLIQAGKSHEATEVAKSIANSSTRDSALTRVAGGNREGRTGVPQKAIEPPPMPLKSEAEEM